MATETTVIHHTRESRQPARTTSIDGNISKDNAKLRSSVPEEAKRILFDCLLGNPSLTIPSQVSECASSVTFTPEIKAFMLTPMRMTESVSAFWSCIGLFASAICQERYHTSRPSSIEVDVHSATLMLMSLALFEINGLEEGEAAQRVDYIDKGHISGTYRAMATNIYKTADDRYFQLHGSLDTTPMLHMLDLPQHRPDIQGIEYREVAKQVYRDVIAKRLSGPLEIEVNERWRQPGVICLTTEEYAKTPHGQSNIKEPLYMINTIHESLPAVPWPESEYRRGPLAGIKVLDLTKVIAGPTITRVLALMGADVLRISSDMQPDAGFALYDGQLGKRDTNLDLKTAQGKDILQDLLKGVDVIVDGYRPGVLAKLGFSETWIHELARQRNRGIVYCRENCYGWDGEWSGRAGYQQISDCVTGASWEQGKFLGLNEPVIPLLPNSDYQTGLVGAIAVMQALLGRSSAGGSYNVFVSLNQFNNWYLRSVGLHDQETQAAIRAQYPDFLPRHDMDIFELISRTVEATKLAKGTGKGQLFDPERFTTTSIRWGKEGEVATYLDWRKIVTVRGNDGNDEAVFDFNSGSCMPGSDCPSWL